MTDSMTATALEMPDLGAMTSAEASAKLSELQADPTWRDNYLRGNGPERRLNDALIERKLADADARLDRIVAGTEAVPEFETVANGELTTHKMMQAAEQLKNFGLNEATVKQALTGMPTSKAEYDAVRLLHRDMVADREWAAKVLAGDPAAVREMLAAATVIANGYVEKAAP
jgi:hypothetical protein